MQASRDSEIKKRLGRLWPVMGKAVWGIQGFEQILAKHYVIVSSVSGPVTKEEIAEEFEKNFAHTIGRLLGKLKSAANVDEAFNSRLEKFVEERHWLVHRLRRENLQQVLQGEEFESLLDRLDALGKEADELVNLFHNMILSHFENLGVPKEEMNKELHAEAERLLSD